MTSLLTKLPHLGFRPAGGLSGRLGCHVVGHRGPNAVVRPWLTRQQIRSSSGDTDALDYNDTGHYATPGLVPSASPQAINKAWSKLNFDLHSDITGKKSKADTEKLLKAVKYREQQQRKEARDKMAARAATNAQAAEAKKRDEALKAQELAERAAERAEAHKQAEKKRAGQEDPAIRAARAAEKKKKKKKKKKADEGAAARRSVAAQAKKA